MKHTSKFSLVNRVLPFILFTIITLAANAQDPNFHIYLCFGQSNMEGSANIEAQDTSENNRFLVFQTLDCPDRYRSKGEWYTATPPLSHCYSNLSPADYFGRTMTELLPDSIKIGVINIAVGGADIRLFDKDLYQSYNSKYDKDWWIKRINDYNGNPYQYLIEMANNAKKDGVIKGILLHQGESNKGDTLWPQYVSKVYNNILKDLDLKAENTPLLSGEVVHKNQGGKAASMNKIINTLPEYIPTSHVVSSWGCPVSKDSIHFNSEGVRELGKRYALKMQSIQSPTTYKNYAWKLKGTDGMPVANFAIASNISQDGSLYNGIAVNPGKLGKWLEYRGKAQLSLSYKDKNYELTGFEKIKNKRQFPISDITYSNHSDIPVKIEIKSWAPVKLNDIFTSSLPVLQTEISITNTSVKKEQIELNINLDSIISRHLIEASGGAKGENIAIIANIDGRYANRKIKYKIDLKGKESKQIRLAISSYDKQWYTAQVHKTAEQTAMYTFDNWNNLYNSTLDFEKVLPFTSDKELNDILRWYLIPAMILTKCTINDEVVTMGYNELNQRDSYWTSWLHLILFKDMERKMIKESIDAIKPNGKIPTTILPKIERMDDLDINAFFILRNFRYYDFHKDDDLLHNNWTSIKAAMDWLITRDADNDGLPEQISYWGDWKDVKGVSGRKYSPFTSLLYLASLKRCSEYADIIKDYSAAEKYKALFEKGFERINKPFNEGGLWKDTYYQSVWYDGRDDAKILQDQMIGVFFDVVPNDRAVMIIETLNKNNRTPYGIAETFPYYDASFGYKPAEYHNGAVWPWLSFMDIWSRLKLGRNEEAIKLIKDVAKADLYDSKDYMPNEHINSLTGQNLGFFIQGWNSAIFGVYYFELKK